MKQQAYENELIDIKPSKKFFFRTLTLDITPEEAIFELVDTFVEWFIFYEKRNMINGKGKIEIELSEEEFHIKSNYPGPPIDIAKKLLRLGEKVEKGCSRIGAYGIGTKRALFKLGRNINLKSSDGEIYYKIEISEKWFEEKEENWKISLYKRNGNGEKFNEINIKKLYPEVEGEFRSPEFVNNFRNKLSNVYIYFLQMYDLDIWVNKEKILPIKYFFLYNKGLIEPYFYSGYTEDKRVKITIIVGITKKENKMYGWHVFCNHRLLIKNDITDRTGFNYDEGIIFNPEDHRIFLGLVFFDSTLSEYKKNIHENMYAKIKNHLERNDLNNLKKLLGLKDDLTEIKKAWDNIWVLKKGKDVAFEIEVLENTIVICSDPINLPWKSSKDDIREDSRVYREAQIRMKNVTERFLSYIEELVKRSREEGINLQKSIESSDKIDTLSLNELLENYYKNVKGERLETFKLIEEEKLNKIIKGFKFKEIRFHLKLDEVKEIKESLGNAGMSDIEMVKRIIDYYRRRKGI